MVVKVTVVEAARWQPLADDFSYVLAKLNENDSVRCAIEEVQRDLQPDELLRHINTIKSRLLARHLLIDLLCSADVSVLSFNTAEKRQVVLANTLYGKPVTSLYRRGDFSVSHVTDWICCAYRDGGAIGVDIAAVDLSDSALLPAILSPKERRQFQNKLPEEQKWGFAAYWSLKEAILKALGLGLSSHLQMSDVSLRFDDEHSPLQTAELKPGSTCTTQAMQLNVALRASNETRWTCALARITGERVHVVAVACPDCKIDTSVEWHFESVENVIGD